MIWATRSRRVVYTVQYTIYLSVEVRMWATRSRRVMYTVQYQIYL